MKKQNTWEKLFDEFMDLIEMGLVKTNKGYFHLRDYTGANLANIESEEFDNAQWLFERLDNYIYDYIVSSLEECLEEKGYKIDKTKILLDHPITSLGVHVINIELHKKVVANVKITVVGK